MAANDDLTMFPSVMQRAIFQFVMNLIQEYRRNLAPIEAAQKTADWLESLAKKIRQEAESYSSDLKNVITPDSDYQEEM